MAQIEHKANILVVDDDRGFWEVVAEGLEARDYRVVAAMSGEECIEKIKSDTFHVILLDLQMPGMNGIQTLEEIRKMNPEIEVLMVTGHGDITTATEALKKGASDFIEKPVSVERLIGIIEKIRQQSMLKETVLLYELSQAIFSTIELDKLLKIIIDLTMRLLRADDASIMLFNEKKELYIAISSGLDLDVQKQTRLAIGERIAGWAVQSKEPLILINGLRNDPRFSDFRGRSEIQSSMIVPLLKNNEAIGVLNANRIKVADNFTKNDIYKGKIFISLVSLALDNANLYNNLKNTRERLERSNEEIRASQAVAMERLAEIEKAHVELETTHQRLVQSEKLSLLGKLVSEVAHEVLNPLMVISGNAQLILARGAQSEETAKGLTVIVEQTMRAKDILQRLLRTARTVKSDLQETDIRKVVESVVGLLEDQFAKCGVAIRRSYEEDLPFVNADAKQLEEVCMNIFNNARDAMSGGGTIEIKAVCEGDFVRVDFKDSGCGMPNEIKARIFEPFLTTKKKGTGLGLSVCYEIIKAHKGELMVESSPGAGTVVSFRLPRAKA
ncbi:MAG: response regulator [Candidatus Omnitrophica bacterium]|nr:response regulator [Candidatus Omnitrophota bacterium]